jgi:hypothetical protein
MKIPWDRDITLPWLYLIFLFRGNGSKKHYFPKFFPVMPVYSRERKQGEHTMDVSTFFKLECRPASQRHPM